MEGKISNVAQDVQRIVDTQAKTGLVLNLQKCEIFANNFDLIDQYSVFSQFKRVQKEDMTFLGSPVLPSRAMDRVFQGKIDDVERTIQLLALLQAHDALCRMKNSIAMPKLLYVLRISPCFDNPLWDIFDDTLRRGFSLVLNVELSDKQWKQANLPVHMGGLEVRSAGMLASSAFLASAAATLPLQDAIHARSFHSGEDPAMRSAILVWTKISQSTIPANALQHVQKAWDSPVTASVYQKLLADPHNTPIDAARLRAVASEHAGDWLHAAPGSMLRQSPQSDYCLTKPSE